MYLFIASVNFIEGHWMAERKPLHLQIRLSMGGKVTELCSVLQNDAKHSYTTGEFIGGEEDA